MYQTFPESRCFHGAALGRFLAILTLLVATSSAVAIENQPRCPALTRIRFYPAEGRAGQMLHGRFTASNEGATTGFETIAEIKQVPAEHQWTEIALANPVRYRFIKYEAPGGSWGNIAEIEFYAGSERIKGTPFGTTGSRDNKGNDFSKAFDGNTATFFDGVEANNQYAGLDLGPASQASAPEFSPKPGNYLQGQHVAITCSSPGAKIRIAHAGGTPSRESGEIVNGPISVERSDVLVAIAYGDDLASSPATVGAYHIGETTGFAKLVRTFHIGNSLTDTVDGFLKPLSESGGHPLDFHRFTIPGAPTEWLWEHPGSGFGDSRYAEAFLAYAPFDALVIQPFAGHGRSIESEADYAGKFFGLCLQRSPNARLWLYQQWPDQTFSEGWSKGLLGLGGKRTDWEKKLELRDGETISDGGWQGVLLKCQPTPSTWQGAVTPHTRYFEILRDELRRRYPQKQIDIIPAGPGLVTVKTMVESGKIPGMTNFFTEFFSDGIHLTSKGRYFVSLVHYASFYNESPEGVSKLNSGLSDEQARILQTVAWETVHGVEKR